MADSAIAGSVVGWHRLSPFQKMLVRDETFKDAVWVKYLIVAPTNDDVLPGEAERPGPTSVLRQLNAGAYRYIQKIDARFKESGGMPDLESDTPFAH